MPRKPTGKPPGRPQKSTEDHLREGTYRPARHRDRAPVRLADRRKIPEDPALEAFLGLASEPPPWWLPCDAILAAILRESLEERAGLRAEVEAGSLSASRELRALDAEIGRLLDSLGLSPTSRRKMGVELPPQEASRLDALRERIRSRSVAAIESGSSRD